MALQNAFRRIFVVGDRLEEFTAHHDVITVSELEKLIELNAGQHRDKYVIRIGQGVQTRRLDAICHRINNLNVADSFLIEKIQKNKKSNCYLTNKRKKKNILISEPFQLENDVYECELMIDDNSADMSDHVTGQHIPGMVLIEAARQMVIAVTKKYHISENQKSTICFVTHSTNANFHTFIFPLPITVKYSILEMRKAMNSNLSSKVCISFIQNNIVAVDVIFTFSALNKEFMKEKEGFLAQQNIEKYFSEV